MAIEDEIRTLQNQVAALQTKKTRAEIETDNARARAVAAKKILVDDYGITDNESMQAKLDALEAALKDRLDEVRTKLDEAGAA